MKKKANNDVNYPQMNSFYTLSLMVSVFLCFLELYKLSRIYADTRGSVILLTCVCCDGGGGFGGTADCMQNSIRSAALAACDSVRVC